MIKRLFNILICFFVLLSFYSSIYAQKETGNNFITNYHAKDYKGHPQNWAITQDSRGFIYIANGNGVIVYDGVSFEMIEILNDLTIRDLEITESDIVYISSNDELGFLQTNERGKVEYVSLRDSLKIEQNVGIIWDIFSNNDRLYFRSEKYLIIKDSAGFKFLQASNSFDLAFIHKNELFIYDNSDGLFILDNDSFIPAPGGKNIAGYNFKTADQLNDNIIFTNNEGGIYIYKILIDGQVDFKLINCEANEFIKNNKVTKSLVHQNQLILATNNGGCLITNSEGEIIKIINIESGLQSNNIKNLFIDNSDNLWLALNIGFAQFNISSSITFWNTNNGLNGMVKNMIRYNDKLYIATDQGVYYLENNIPVKLNSPVPKSWSFLKYSDPVQKKEHLLLATEEGIYKIVDNKFIYITGSEATYTLYQSKLNPQYIYFGTINDIGILEYKNGLFTFKGMIAGTGISVRSIKEEENGELWTSSFRHHVYRIFPSDDILKPKQILKYGINSGLPSLKNILIFELYNETLFATENGLYTFDKQNDMFISDKRFSSLFTSKKKDIFTLIESDSSNIWITQLDHNKSSLGKASLGKDGKYIWKSEAFNLIPEMLVLTLYKDQEDECLWIGGSEGLFHYHPQNEQNYIVNNKAFIREVILNNDSTIFFGNYFKKINNISYFTEVQNDDLKFFLDFKNNNISFLFASPEFIDEFSTEYQFFLDGFDDRWSEWSNITKKEYTNLPEGNYKFRVKAKNIYNKISEEAVFEFHINPPWYRTNFAYALYVITAILLIGIVVKLSIRRLKMQNVELERQVVKRTYEIQRKNEEILAQSDELERKNIELFELSTVADKTDNAIAIADENGKLQWVNDGFTRLYGYTLKDLQFLGYDTIVDFSISENIKETIDFCLSTGKSINYESLNHSKTGKNIWAQTTITPILNENNLVKKLIAIDSDISKLKLSESEVLQQKDEIKAQRDFAERQKKFIEEQNKELEKHRNQLEQLVKERTDDLLKAKEKAEESDRLKSAFLANMSHEIRTPMNAIIGFSNLLNSMNFNKQKRKELISYIVLNSNTLLHLIDDIIDISKIEAGQLEINNEICYTYEIFDDLKEIYEDKHSFSDKKIEIKFLKDSSNDAVLYTDKIRIQQVLINLVDNAHKFTEKGHIKIGYSINDNIEVIFYVKDTGIGLTKRQQNKIFKRFTKLENEREKLYRGAGLGLSICKNIIKLLGGEIWVDSEIKKGSTFYFSIPYEQGLQSKSKRKLKNILQTVNDLSDKTILIAEDEISNFKLLEMILTDTNINIIHATDGIEAYEKYYENDIDLILMDIKMPRADGLSAVKKIRKTDNSIPIIVQTAFAMENDKTISIQAGCNDYISKPINKEKLLSLLNKYLS